MLNDRLEETIHFLLRKAELNILAFEQNRRTKMGFMNRRLPFYVMSYHKEGTAKLRIGGDQLIEVPPKTVLFIPPFVLHDHFKDTGERTEFMYWHFTFMIDRVFDVLQFFQIPYQFPLRNFKLFEETFAGYLAELERPKTGFPLGPILEKAKSYELLYYLLQEALACDEMSALTSQAHRFLDILVHIFQKPEQPLSLRELAVDYHMNATYISNRFKALYGIGPIQLQREVRIQKARSLLAASDLPVAEIGRLVGCEELQHFSRLFKSIVGMSPSDYRRASRNSIKSELL
ncbi:helix-turn-helix domain-containing protein [Cohnella fermenti]|nr:helix-turn-helix domain-containing protein [Cohnella fermenti]